MYDDAPAEEISQRIRDRHLLFGFIGETTFNRIFEIVGTSGNGDGALWTGTYLAAEAFHYRVTGQQHAWDAMYEALIRVRDLSRIAPTGFVARTIFPTESPFTKQLADDEKHSGLFLTTYRGVSSYWVGHPTRDQYCGVLLGLAVTYDLICGNDQRERDVRDICRDTISYLVGGLIANNWKTSNPDGSQSESFHWQPAQLLSALSLARHVDAGRFGAEYECARGRWWRLAGLASWANTKVLRRRYFYMNLDHCYYYKLIEHEDDPKMRKRFLKQFSRLRHATQDHGNPHFNMIERALTGANTDRDAETIRLLDLLRKREFRNTWVEDAEKESRTPVPVSERPYADFLWQRAPFALRIPGDGLKESPGIDYILPYWMARFFEVIE